MAEKNKNDVEKLKHHLSMLLDAEASRTAEEMDVRKIARILEMIEMCGDHAQENDIDKFTENFNRKYHTSIKPVKKPRTNRIMPRFSRIASCFILFVFLFCGTELIAVKAFDFSIIQFIRVSANRLVFQADGHKASGNADAGSPEGDQDYESLSEMLNIRFLVPEQGMPEALELENVEYSEFSDSILATYLDRESYVIWEIILPSGQGTIDYNTQDLQAVDEDLAVGDKRVSVYRVKADDKEAYTVTFVYKGILYVLESDLSLEKIITILEEAEEVNEKNHNRVIGCCIGYSRYRHRI